jgi:hypothetical protein
VRLRRRAERDVSIELPSINGSGWVGDRDARRRRQALADRR